MSDFLSESGGFALRAPLGLCLTPLLERTHILSPPIPKREKISTAFNTHRINRTDLVFPGLYQGESLAGKLGQSDTQLPLSGKHIGKRCVSTLYPHSSCLMSMKQPCSLCRGEHLGPVIYLPSMLYTVVDKIYVEGDSGLSCLLKHHLQKSLHLWGYDVLAQINKIVSHFSFPLPFFNVYARSQKSKGNRVIGFRHTKCVTCMLPFIKMSVNSAKL